MMITTAMLVATMPRLPKEKAEEFSPLLADALREFEVNTAKRTAGFLSQMAHESAQLTRWEENLNYSARGLMSTWPKRFPGEDFAKRFERNPQKIANFVYAGRGGNGDEFSGDGWRFRGRGPGQLTFKANYAAMGSILGLDLVANPDLVATPSVGFRAFGAFWRENGLNQLADAGDVVAMRKRVNGGLLGLDEVRVFYARALAALGAGS